MADLLALIGLKRSTYYYLEAHPLNTSSDNKIADVIRQIKSPQFQTEYGYRRVTTLLHDQGYLVNHKRVLRIMGQNALLSTTYNTRKRRYNSYRGTVGRPNVSLNATFKLMHLTKRLSQTSLKFS